MSFPLANSGFFRKGGLGPMFTANGLSFASLATFLFDFDGFTEITGSGDYTFMAWYKFGSTNATNRVIIYGQNTSFANTANRISITNRAVEVNATTYGDNVTTRNAGESQCIVVKKNSGTTTVFHLINGVYSSIGSLSVPDVASPTQRSIGATLTTGINQTNAAGEMLSIQITNSALADIDIQDLMENYDILPSTTTSLPFYTELTGSSDNGAYPAIMSAASTPSPYVVSASFFNAGEFPWRAFDGDFTTRTIIRNAAGTASATGWLKIDLGSGNEQAVDAYYFRSFAAQGLNSFTVAGSNDDITYTDLFTGNGANNNTTLQKFTWTNSTTYRYYRITCNSGFNATQWTHFQSLLVDESKEWTSGGGFAKDAAMTFPI
jgi:hypothetical protein